MVVTGAPRKRLVGKPARGFESHPLRQTSAFAPVCRSGWASGASRLSPLRAAPGRTNPCRSGWASGASLRFRHESLPFSAHLSHPLQCSPRPWAVVRLRGQSASAQGRIADGTGGTVFRDGNRGVSKGAELALQVQGGEGERLVGAFGVECSRHASGVRDPPERLSLLFDDEYVGGRRRARRRRGGRPDGDVAVGASEGELAFSSRRLRHGRLGGGRRATGGVTISPRRREETGPRWSSRKKLRTF